MPLSTERERRARRWLSGVETGLGIALAVTPVTLWVAWTPSVFFAAVAVAAGSAFLLVLLNGRWRPASGHAHPTPSESCSQPVLPDEFVERIHQIFPLTYHHSSIGRARYRDAMQRLRQLLP